MAVANVKANRVGKFMREVRAELRKVNWPNRRELLTYTVVVVATVVVMSAFIGVVDLLVSQLQRIPGLG